MVKEISIEVGENGEFIGVSSFISASQPSSGRAVKLCFYTKCFNCTFENWIEIERMDTLDKCCIEQHCLLPCVDSLEDSRVGFLLKSSGVYRATSQTGSSFMLQIHPMVQLPLGKSILVQQICLQTVVPKWMEQMSGWERHFKKLAASGFNAVYFLPLQEFGCSGSPYSIANHHSTFLSGGMAQLKAVMQLARSKYGIISIGDVVLNHAAKDAPWLLQHPECTFNLENTPALANAYALESIMLAFSDAISPFQPTAQNIDWLMEELAKKIASCLDFATPELVHRVIRNVRGTVYWERIENQSKGPITKASPMIPNYFTILHLQKRNFIFANNGWSSGASKGTAIDIDAYLYRELNPWTDCVKLNYGCCAKENPWLWNYMRIYISELASVFDGIRLDNCHSTPLNVAKWLLFHARKLKPALVVVAELFTNSREMDCTYVSQLGINLLTRECLAFNRISDYVGYSFAQFSIGQPLGAFKRRFHASPLTLLMDCTHDNESPAKLRSIFDFIPNMAICSFFNAAIGSTMGYDDLNRQKYNIATENVQNYMEKPNTLGKVRKFFNNVHQKMVKEQCNYYHSECIEGKVVKITRSNDKNGTNYTLFAFPVFGARTTGVKVQLDYSHYAYSGAFYACLSEGERELHVKRFDTVAFEDYFLVSGSILVLKSKAKFQIPSIFLPPLGFDLYQLNILLFRHASEEKKAIGWESYQIPDWGSLFYCGFQSAFDVFAEAFATGDLEHPICRNVREGNWFVEWQCERLSRYSDSIGRKEREELQRLLCGVKEVPVGYRPVYLYSCIRAIYNALKARALELLHVSGHNSFVQQLALTSVQLVGVLEGSGLKKEREKEEESAAENSCTPEVSFTGDLSVETEGSLTERTSSSAPTSLYSNASLSAGLPHFSTGCFRCWGRDTFVSFRGIFLLLGRFEDAKMHLLAFAACLKDGMIPNLLDAGQFPRFNSRDTSWWFLNAVKQYCEAVGNTEIFAERVEMRFGSGERMNCTDASQATFYRTTATSNQNTCTCSPNIPSQTASPYTAPSTCSHQTKTLLQIILCILHAHWNGIHLQENYPFLDTCMQPQGKQIDIATCKHTGFLFGGNEYNAGTWMDKMNETTKLPSTPRCGSNIEIVALSFAFLEWFSVQPEGQQFVLWKTLIQTNFMHHFYAPELGYFYDTLPLDAKNHSPTKELRPNTFIAMAVAPALFTTTPSQCKLALETAERVLLTPLGIKTLSPSDANYHSCYIAHRNPAGYHNGPEWLWIFGHWAKARMNLQMPFSLQSLKPHWKMLCNSQAKGLVELTNAKGSPCESACSSQAWSNAVILEVLMDVQQRKEQ